MKKIKGNKTRKNRGGVRIINDYNEERAISYFLKNSYFTILGDDSISCIPILATLKNDENIIKNSPYKNIRTNNLNTEVRQILLKIFICGTKEGIVDDENLGRGYINVTPTEAIKREIKIQQDVYNKSFYNNTTIMEPICPCIVFANVSKLSNEQKNIIVNIMKENIIERNIKKVPSDKEIINRLLNYDIAFIAMEFMKGFEPLNKFQNDSNYERYKEMALYELDKLHKLRYCHNDFHFQNVMINPTYKYFTTNDKDDMGRALIIDFGLSTRIPENVDMENKENRIKLLNDEYGKVNMNIIDKFNALDNKHMIIQSSYIEALEKRLKKNIRDIISIFKIYKGIGGNKCIKSMDKIEDNEEYQKNQSKLLDDWLKTQPKKKKREEFLDTDDNWYEKLQEKRIIAFEESLKESDPEYYEEFTKNLDRLREELDKDPDYLHNMIKDALSPPYITENFTFRETSTETMNTSIKNK